MCPKNQSGNVALGSEIAPALLPKTSLYRALTISSAPAVRSLSPIEGLTGVGENKPALPNPAQTKQRIGIIESALESNLGTRKLAQMSAHQDFGKIAVNTYLDYAEFEQREYLSDALGVDVYV